MQFMLAIMYDPTLPPDPIEGGKEVHEPLGEAMRARGQYIGGFGLAPAERYRKRLLRVDGELVFSDGPFTETKEALGGYFLVECTEEEAMEWAKRIVHDSRSWVEIRAAWGDR